MHNCRVFNASGKFIRGEFSKTGVLLYEKFLGDLLCHVATWSSHVATSNFHPSATSRRHFNTPLPRRDVYSHVATSNCKALCHVATWNSHVATWTSHVATSLLHVATSFGHVLCHVATWDFTSRRGLVCPLSRCDVAPHVATSSSLALCHVAT